MSSTADLHVCRYWLWGFIEVQVVKHWISRINTQFHNNHYRCTMWIELSFKTNNGSKYDKLKCQKLNYTESLKEMMFIKNLTHQGNKLATTCCPSQRTNWNSTTIATARHTSKIAALDGRQISLKNCLLFLLKECGPPAEDGNKRGWLSSQLEEGSIV